jgi:hypothetical protein
MRNLTSAALLFLVSFPLAVKSANAQTPQSVVTPIQTSQHLDGRYRLVPTQNLWTFLLLDSSNGRIWQLQYTIADRSPAGRIPINPDPLVDEAQEKVGRYAIYTTQNMYNFILLDQETGRAWQVQWSTTNENRGIVRDLNTEF